ncbi:MAG TPA: hypothetical protein VFO19_15855 [Vicinamibacterales bacterium]|nr:hypothetical protein [Vicinamibacterales bacterium]
MTQDEAIAQLTASLARMQDDLQQARAALAALRGGDAAGAGPPPGAGSIVRVRVLEALPPFEGVSRKTGKPFTKFKVKASDGQVYETFSESINETLMAAMAAGGEVEIAFTESRFGRDLVSARRQASDDEQVPLPTDDEIPF